MGESLKGFISVELFFFKNVTYDAKNSWQEMEQLPWPPPLNYANFKPFFKLFWYFFFSETKEILCPKLHIKRIYSTPKKPKTIIKIIWWWEEKWGFAEAEVFTPKWLRNGSWTSSFDCWHDIIVKCTWKAIKEENKVKPRNIIKQQGKTYWVI